MAGKQNQIAAEYHDISLAVMMAMFLPGGGQLYNGQTVKGILLIILTFAGVFGVTFHPNAVTLLLGGVGEFTLWLAGMIDAGMIARRLRHGETVSAWRWF